MEIQFNPLKKQTSNFYVFLCFVIFFSLHFKFRRKISCVKLRYYSDLIVMEIEIIKSINITLQKRVVGLK